MHSYILWLSLVICANVFGLGCVGPTTPFGSINSVKFDSRTQEEKNEDPFELFQRNDTEDFSPLVYRDLASVPVKIEFFPRRQVLHKNDPWGVEIKGITSDHPEKYVKIYYNKIDVTKNYLKLAQAQIVPGEYRLYFKNLALRADQKNNIRVYYKEPRQKPHWDDYYPPTCSVFEKADIQNTQQFSPPHYYLKLIDMMSQRYQMNPNLVAGLVATESGFNPRAVSWARAIGLTQITPLAEQQVVSEHTYFPRYPNINDYTYPLIKGLIVAGKISESDEWRLNPIYSIQGGLTYLEYIDKYWHQTENAKIFNQLPGDKNVLFEQILLASYNAGPARVKSAILAGGKKWLDDPRLGGVRKYVGLISSYCYHFSQGNPKRGTASL